MTLVLETAYSGTTTNQTNFLRASHTHLNQQAIFQFAADLKIF